MLRARLGSTPDFPRTSCTEGTARPAARNAFSILPEASASSCLQRNLVRCQAYGFAIRGERLSQCQQRVQQPSGAPGNCLLRSSSFERPPQQRILPVKLLQRLVHCFQLARHPFRIEQPELRRVQHHQLVRRGRLSGYRLPAVPCAPPAPAFPFRSATRSPAARCARRSGAVSRIRRRSGAARRGAAISSTTPPPMVTTGENMRTMKRSPGQQQQRLAQQKADVVARAGRNESVPRSRRISASTSAVPA